MLRRTRRRAGGAQMMRAAALAVLLAAGPARAGDLAVLFLSLDLTHAPPAAALVQPPRDTALRGAILAASDNNTTGRFTGQTTTLTTIVSPDPDAILAGFAKALESGRRLFVVDVPAPLLLRLADVPAAAAALILDATSADDSLRGRDCRANTLHLLPSHAMLADALMQYLASRDWRHVMLLTGRTPADALFATALRNAAEKFQLTLAADAAWMFNPAAQQADTGHFQLNDEVRKATQGVSYDVLVAADEAHQFADQLSYRTDTPRPVMGSAGLVPTAWSPVMDEYASTQLQLRFRRATGRDMTARDYGAWLAVRALGEAATRSASTDPATIGAYMRGPAFALSGYKGPEFSFRPWDGQLRQPVLLADDHGIVSISPQPGYLHEKNDLDSLGTDEPETQCKH